MTQPKDVVSDKGKLSSRVTDAVLQHRYVPWKLLDTTHPHLTPFLRRVMQEEQPYFNSAAEVIDFILNEDNATVFQFQAPHENNHCNTNQHSDTSNSNSNSDPE